MGFETASVVKMSTQESCVLSEVSQLKGFFGAKRDAEWSDWALEKNKMGKQSSYMSTMSGNQYG